MLFPFSGVLFHQRKLMETIFSAPAVPWSGLGSTKASAMPSPSALGEFAVRTWSWYSTTWENPCPIASYPQPVLPIPSMVCHTKRLPGQSLATELVTIQFPHLLTQGVLRADGNTQFRQNTQIYVVTMGSVSDLLALGKCPQKPCCGLTLAGCHISTKAALSLPPLLLERKYNEKLVEIRIGRDHSSITVVGKQTQLGEVS